MRNVSRHVTAMHRVIDKVCVFTLSYHATITYAHPINALHFDISWTKRCYRPSLSPPARVTYASSVRLSRDLSTGQQHFLVRHTGVTHVKRTKVGLSMRERYFIPCLP